MGEVPFRGTITGAADLGLRRFDPQPSGAPTLCGWRAGLGTVILIRIDAMPQFDATIKHIQAGVKGFTVKAAVSNIEGWEATLEKSEASGVKTLVKDLENLKKHIQAESPNGEQIKKLLAKLGKETVTLAGKSEGKNAEKAKALGEALTHMVEAED
jgi:hypothetical protein